MKKYICFIVILSILSFMMIACDDDNEQNGIDDNSEVSHTEDKQNNTDEDSDDSKQDNVADATAGSEEAETGNNHTGEASSNDEAGDSNNQSEDEQGSGLLSEYSSEEIEYARVWLQLGENQDIDKLYAERIPAGEPLNPDDETSLDYPEDVVQLSGSRLVDGVVTYSSNGDGTVNVYAVPKRWDGKSPAGEDAYKKVIDDTEQESIDPGSDGEVKALIAKLNID